MYSQINFPTSIQAIILYGSLFFFFWLLSVLDHVAAGTLVADGYLSYPGLSFSLQWLCYRI